MTSSSSPALVEGPYFDELKVGQVFDQAPALTLSEGLASAHRGILGERLRLPLDQGLAVAVTGRSAIASPALVWNVAVGQSTVATQHVKANLFYRRLALLRQPAIGDTVRTTTTVVGLRENSRREGRAATGLAALHMRTLDQDDRTVLDFYRCAMLPLRGQAPTGHDDDLATIGVGRSELSLEEIVPRWDAAAWADRCKPRPAPSPGQRLRVVGGDVVTSAAELARLTLNVAVVHHDAKAGGGRRLVYGGHTIGLALAQVTRALPDLVTVLSWESCDHVGPVHEGDTLRTELEVERLRPAGAWVVADLRARVTADGDPEERPVLDWRFSGLLG